MGRMNLISNGFNPESREGQLTLVAIVMMMYVMAVFFAIAIHELVGHGLFTVLLGGDFFAIYISPGSGYISFYLPDTMSSSEIALIYMAGIMVQIVLGLMILFLVFPRIKNFFWGIFALLFSTALLVHPALYLFLGYFYQSGDTRYAVILLQLPPDIFLVAGLIMTGLFIILISTRALNFLGSFIDVGSEAVRNKTLFIFWLPPILLSGFSALLSAYYVDESQVAYTITNALMVLMFMAISIFLIPQFVDPPKTRESRISSKAVMSVMVVFLLVLSSWLGIFGLSRESAHGLMLHEPPIGAERYYSDYSVGNAEIFVYHNGTAKVDIILRGQQDNPSPLEQRIFHTFDQRPDWDWYRLRSQNMVVKMFDLPREVGENLTFTTSLGTARALGVEDEYGRMCTTYVHFAQEGTRQIFREGIGEGLRLVFKDPWQLQNPKGFLDEVRVSCGDDLRIDGANGVNEYYNNISWNRGSRANNSIGWKNIDLQFAPAEYTVIFTDPIVASDRS